MKKLYFFNGNFSEESPNISLHNRALFFGDGIYDAAMGKEDKILWLDEHVSRFLKNAKFLGVSCPYSESRLKDIFKTGGEKFGDSPYFLYFSLMRCAEDRKHVWQDSDASDFLAVFSETSIPDETYSPKLILSEDNRFGLCNVKTLNLLPNVLAAKEAENRGADEAVFVRSGIVTEGTHSNISVVLGRQVWTHPQDNTVLPGITRAHLKKSAKKLGLFWIEKPFSPDVLTEADGVVLTSTSKLAVLCSSVDEIPLKPPSGIAKKLCHTLFKEYASFFSK